MSTEISPAKVALRVAARRLAEFTRARHPMLDPPYPPEVARRIEQYHDEVRYTSLALAIQRLETDQIPGAFAEIGVYRGVTSSFIHQQTPHRKFFLFDTFQGFPEQSLEGGAVDNRFQDSSQERVAEFLGNSPNLVFRKGFFPDTAIGLEDERFALVMLDVDLYQPALDVLDFFYPRLTRGAFLFLHDYNSPESHRAIARAAHKFLADKPELLIELPDFNGSAVFRKS